MKNSETKVLLIAIMLVQLWGMVVIDLMEHDATQYATISMQMLRDNSWLQIYWREVSYLDKPPLLFWLSAISFKFFGISHFAYRFPSFLILLLGAYSTWQLTRRLYNLQTANLTVLILFSTQGVFHMAHDVRTDTMLVGWIMFVVWQLYLFIKDNNKTAFVLAFTGIGLAMLTKGPLGLVIPALAFGPQLVLQKRWRTIFNPVWFLGLLIVMLVISPMLYGLILQHGREGIEFYFWKQSFGRLTGENVWHDDSGPMFFIHSFAWSFLPWTLVALYGVYHKAKELFKNPASSDSFMLWGSVLVFVAMSNAQYKLPHYIYVIFPFVAIMTAKALVFDERLKSKFWFSGQLFTIILLVAGMVFLMMADFSWALLAIFIPGLLIILWITFNPTSRFDVNKRAILASLVVIITANAMLNVVFYPKLLGYQSGSVAGRYVKEAEISEKNLCFFVKHSPSFDFYSEQIIPFYRTTSQLDSALMMNNWMMCYTNQNGFDLLNNPSYILIDVIEFDEYKATKLGLPYIFSDKRKSVLGKTFLVKVKRNQFIKAEN